MSPIIREEQLGQAQVRQSDPRGQKLALSLDVSSLRVSINRGDKNFALLEKVWSFYEGLVSSLKRFKDDVKEVAKGYECGVGTKISTTSEKMITSKASKKSRRKLLYER